MDELEPKGGLQSKLVATLEKGVEDRETLRNELVQAANLLERLDPVLKTMYRASVEAEYDVNAANYAVLVASNAGYRKAIRDVYRLLYPEVTP